MPPPSEEWLKEVRFHFRGMAAPTNQELNRESFRKLVKQLMEKNKTKNKVVTKVPSDADLNVMFDLADVDKSGKVSLDEFVALYKLAESDLIHSLGAGQLDVARKVNAMAALDPKGPAALASDDGLEELRQGFDAAGQGRPELGLPAFAELMGSLLGQGKGVPSGKDLEVAFSLADAHGSGLVSWAEFAPLYRLAVAGEVTGLSSTSFFSKGSVKKKKESILETIRIHKADAAMAPAVAPAAPTVAPAVTAAPAVAAPRTASAAAATASTIKEKADKNDDDDDDDDDGAGARLAKATSVSYAPHDDRPTHDGVPNADWHEERRFDADDIPATRDEFLDAYGDGGAAAWEKARLYEAAGSHADSASVHGSSVHRSLERPSSSARGSSAAHLSALQAKDAVPRSGGSGGGSLGRSDGGSSMPHGGDISRGLCTSRVADPERLLFQGTDGNNSDGDAEVPLFEPKAAVAVAAAAATNSFAGAAKPTTAAAAATASTAGATLVVGATSAGSGDDARASNRARLIALYQQKNPTKVGDVDKVLAKWGPDSAGLWAAIRKKYGDAAVEALGPPELKKQAKALHPAGASPSTGASLSRELATPKASAARDGKGGGASRLGCSADRAKKPLNAKDRRLADEEAARKKQKADWAKRQQKKGSAAAATAGSGADAKSKSLGGPKTVSLAAKGRSASVGRPGDSPKTASLAAKGRSASVGRPGESPEDSAAKDGKGGGASRLGCNADRAKKPLNAKDRRLADEEAARKKQKADWAKRQQKKKAAEAAAADASAAAPAMGKGKGQGSKGAVVNATGAKGGGAAVVAAAAASESTSLEEKNRRAIEEAGLVHGSAARAAGGYRVVKGRAPPAGASDLASDMVMNVASVEFAAFVESEAADLFREVEDGMAVTDALRLVEDAVADRDYDAAQADAVVGRFRAMVAGAKARAKARAKAEAEGRAKAEAEGRAESKAAERKEAAAVEEAMPAALAFTSSISLLPFSVLGQQVGMDGKVRTGAGPDALDSPVTAIVDLAEMRHIQPPGGPRSSGGASRALYARIGIESEDRFPEPVVDAIKVTGDAKYVEARNIATRANTIRVCLVTLAGCAVYAYVRCPPLSAISKMFTDSPP